MTTMIKASFFLYVLTMIHSFKVSLMLRTTQRLNDYAVRRMLTTSKNIEKDPHHTLTSLSARRSKGKELYKAEDLDEGGLGPQAINWYPGHIAKAERELSDYLKRVDVVIEVRDARIPISTTHPSVPSWVGKKPLIVAIARLDQISKKALADWKEYYTLNPPHPERPDAKVFFVDGKLGAGVLGLKRYALKAGISVNERRIRRGINPRAVRAAVIGFPNVGKSALINRLLGSKMAQSKNMPGVTRSLRWVRLGGDAGANAANLELLDSPGIIPARQFDQVSATKLAICNDIGEASYDRVIVAAEMCDLINSIHHDYNKYIDMKHILSRYKFPFNEMTGDEIIYEIAERYYHGNIISAADKLLGDYRKNLLKFASLEAPEEMLKEKELRKQIKKQQKDHKDEMKIYEEEKSFDSLDIGKGNYEGW